MSKTRDLTLLLDGNGKVKDDFKPQIGVQHLKDVDVTNLQINETLKWNSTNSRFEPGVASADLSSLVTKASVDASFNAILGTAPPELDTLSEIQAALQNDNSIGGFWYSYKRNQSTKTWKGMTGKGPTGTFPYGTASGNTVTLTNGIDGNGVNQGIPMELDAQWAKVEVSLNGVLLRNVYRHPYNPSDLLPTYDYFPAAIAGSYSGAVTVLDEMVSNVSFDSYNGQIMIEFMSDQYTLDTAFSYLGNSYPGTEAIALKTGVNGPIPGGNSDGHDLDGTETFNASYSWDGAMGIGTVTLNQVEGSNDPYSVNSTATAAWASDTGAWSQGQIVKFENPNAGGSGISVWDGYNGPMPWFNFVVFPSITFNATDVVTIRTY